ncbi:MAG: ribosome maturation factor RimP [Lachnospiraceae bacterium]|nr:ribosome maturation factor RimP [Lachnospiraceae bacterium]
MGKHSDYAAKTEALVQPIVDEYGFELVDVEFVKEADTNYLRVFIDKEGGITINECETVSRRVSDLLDEKDFIDESYIFEVSSPGLGRVLKKDKDFQRSLGAEVEVKLFKAVDGQKEFTGYLDDFDEKTITIGFEDESQVTFERQNIAKINLAVHF